MAATKIADIIQPEVFDPYVTERTAELASLYLGGVISRDPQFDALASSGGKLLKMPFYKDLTGNDEVLADNASLTPGNITTAQDQARLHMRGRAWGVNDLAKALSGDDPMRAIADLVAAYWARRYQSVLINSLEGVFADNVANDSADMVHDIASESVAGQSAATKIGPDAIIAATGTLGDAFGSLSAIAVHSAVFQELQRQNVIVYETPAGQSIKFPTYLGYRLIVDDGCPVAAGGTDGFKYTSYLFGEGAVALGQGGAPVPSETDRDSLAGEDYLITRSHFLMHPRGVAWQEASVAGEAPTNAETAAAANWSRVWERKNVRVAQLVTN